MIGNQRRDEENQLSIHPQSFLGCRWSQLEIQPLKRQKCKLLHLHQNLISKNCFLSIDGYIKDDLIWIYQCEMINWIHAVKCYIWARLYVCNQSFINIPKNRITFLLIMNALESWQRCSNVSTCEFSKVNQKLSFYFKFVLFFCHKVDRNGENSKKLSPKKSPKRSLQWLRQFSGSLSIWWPYWCRSNYCPFVKIFLYDWPVVRWGS